MATLLARRRKRNRDTHPLLERMGVTEIPPILRKLGVTAESLDEMTEDDLRGIVRKVRTLSSRLRSAGPSTDDELHAWVVDNIGVDIPRVAVCADHVAPFTLLADLYFHRTSAALALANRGGAKTFIVAVLHFVNATYKPGYGGLSFGSTEAQSNRCYGHIEDWCYEVDKESGRRTDRVKPFIRDKPLKSHTTWKTGSVVEVVAGSINAVSGPHPSLAHGDEIDLMERPVWDQSRGMAVTNRATGQLPPWMARFKGMIPPQDVATSTRNSTKGLMQEIIDEVGEDLKSDSIPQFDLYPWCIWETVAEVPNCRCELARKRKARLRELSMDADSLCECHRVPKGRHKDGTKRTLEQSCAIKDDNGKLIGGKGFKARGWKPYIDLVRTFKRNTPGTWLLQHECRHGRDENSYIEDWSLSDYGIRHYEPHPLYGPIYQGVDWGTTHPAAVLWVQYLTAEVPGLGFEFEPIWLQPGIYVLFKEIYVAGLGADSLAKRVNAVENEYRRQYGKAWKVKGRFCDPQGAGERITFNNHGLSSSWPVKTRNKERMITIVQNLVIDDRFVADVQEAPMFCEEIEIWQKKPETGKELDKFNHTMAAWRYVISNAEIIESKQREKGGRSTGVAPMGAAERVQKRAQHVILTRRQQAVESGQTHYGANFAASGGTSVQIPRQFTLQHR